MDRNAMVGKVWDAMAGLPKPVEREQALEAALAVLTWKASGDFAKWFDVYGDYVLGRLNG